MDCFYWLHLLPVLARRVRRVEPRSHRGRLSKYDDSTAHPQLYDKETGRCPDPAPLQLRCSARCDRPGRSTAGRPAALQAPRRGAAGCGPTDPRVDATATASGGFFWQLRKTAIASLSAGNLSTSKSNFEYRRVRNQRLCEWKHLLTGVRTSIISIG